MKGNGLKCCRNGQDSIERFIREPKWANSDTHFYIANIDDIFMKFGITDNLDRRKYRGKYKGYEFIFPIIKRSNAWVLEQIILIESSHLYPEWISDKYINIGGITEIRSFDLYEIDYWEKRYTDLYDLICKTGWIETFKKFIG